jgi:4-hydroxy-3-polyprenylbenzoate decarboxylase
MKIAIAITGASGAIYASQLFKTIEKNKHLFSDVGIVWTDNAKDVWKHELGNEDFHHYNFKTYSIKDYFAPFASGSAGYDALIICPCSMGTIGRIAHGISDSLITRTADVMLKERKKLICIARETPYNLIHINNMKIITEAGGTILPASPSFYSLPQTIEDAAQTVIDRVFKLIGLDINSFKWGTTER